MLLRRPEVLAALRAAALSGPAIALPPAFARRSSGASGMSGLFHKLSALLGNSIGGGMGRRGAAAAAAAAADGTTVAPPAEELQEGAVPPPPKRGRTRKVAAAAETVAAVPAAQALGGASASGSGGDASGVVPADIEALAAAAAPALKKRGRKPTAAATEAAAGATVRKALPAATPAAAAASAAGALAAASPGRKKGARKPAVPSEATLASLPELQAKGAKIAELLGKLYPRPPIPLDHGSNFQLLCAVLLSAQTTDKAVNLCTPALFALAPDAPAMAAADVAAIAACIKTLGLAPTKAKNLRAMSQMLVECHGGEVPESFEALEALPGVGHKTASVVMAQAFGHDAFPVDTHIHRLAQRWGLTPATRSVEQTEADLKAVFPAELWNPLHLQIIYFGREFCAAKAHEPSACPICSWAAVPPFDRPGGSPAKANGKPGPKPRSSAAAAGGAAKPLKRSAAAAAGSDGSGVDVEGGGAAAAGQGKRRAPKKAAGGT